jgi:stage V sporulation protein AB
MWIRYVILIIVGIGGGAVTAAGYFAVLASVGVITRFADYTNTANRIRLYETFLCLGGITGNVLIIFNPSIQIWSPLTAVVGLLMGIFVGCFLLSLAEAVKGLPIFLRKSRIQKGISLLIISFAIGKTIGSLFYFYYYLGINNN